MDSLYRSQQEPAFVFQGLVNGRHSSTRAIAIEEAVSDPYISQLLPLAFLAPGIIDAILAGRQPAVVSV